LGKIPPIWVGFIFITKEYIMKKIVRLTESDLTNIVKRVIKEMDDDILTLGDGSMLMGGSSLMGGGRPTEKTDLDFAILQLKNIIVLLNYLPEKLSMEDRLDLEKLYGSYIKSAFYAVRKSEEETEELSHYVGKIKNHIKKVLDKKTIGSIE
jgi:hypothetical protein